MSIENECLCYAALKQGHSCWLNQVETHVCNLAIMQGVMMDFPDIIIGFGESDEYSFVLHKDTALYGGFQFV